jgi:hypothetical protein
MPAKLVPKKNAKPTKRPAPATSSQPSKRVVSTRNYMSADQFKENISGLSAAQRDALGSIALALKTDAVKLTKVKKCVEPNATRKKPEFLSPYMAFAKERRSSALDESPGLSLTDLAKKLGTEWKALTDEQKLTYKNKIRPA